MSCGPGWRTKGSWPRTRRRACAGSAGRSVGPSPWDGGGRLRWGAPGSGSSCRHPSPTRPAIEHSSMAFVRPRANGSQTAFLTPCLRRGGSRSFQWDAFGLGKAEGQVEVLHCLRRSALEQVVERSEEHTSELQSLMRISYAVFCLKKKKNTP